MKKYIFIKRWLIGTWLVACLFFILPKTSGAIALTEDNILKIINKQRVINNLSTLAANERLSLAAENKLADMQSKNYFSHISPLGWTAWDFIEQAGYDYQYAAENLAVDYTIPEKLVDGWLASQAHKQNLLNPVYQDAGLAIGGTGSHKRIVLFFGKKIKYASKIVKARQAVLPAEKNNELITAPDNTAIQVPIIITKNSVFENKTTDRQIILIKSDNQINKSTVKILGAFIRTGLLYADQDLLIRNAFVTSIGLI